MTTQPILPPPPNSSVDSSTYHSVKSTSPRENLKSSRSRPQGPSRSVSTSNYLDHTTEIHAGTHVFKLPTSQLLQQSRYLQGYLLGVHTSTPKNSPRPVFKYPGVDHQSLDLFSRFLRGQKLSGPSDFHSVQHYMGLYIIAHKLDIERLANNVMDLIRSYYRRMEMSAPMHRIQFVYQNTTEGVFNWLRKFVVHSAAFRLLADAGMGALGVPMAMRGVILAGGEMAVDLLEALMQQHWSGLKDPSKGHDCDWHNHEVTKTCERKK